MKQTFLLFLLCFVVGLATGYGLAHLDRRAEVVTVSPTEVFRVSLGNGTYQHLSYADVQRDRRELDRLRSNLHRAKRSRVTRPTRTPTLSPPSPPRSHTRPDGAHAESREESRQRLGALFAKIFSKSVMSDVADARVQRQVGELSAVLDLTEEQQGLLREALARRDHPEGPPPGPGEREEALEEIYRSVFSPEQYQRYREYRAAKNDMAGAPTVDREVFELSWRLNLTEDQKVQVTEICRQRQNRLEKVSRAESQDAADFPGERLRRYVEEREAAEDEEAQQMRDVLGDEQYAAYEQYRKEKDPETRILETMVAEEPPPEGVQPPP